jgi:hypothetical protein
VWGLGWAWSSLISAVVVVVLHPLVGITQGFAIRREARLIVEKLERDGVIER